MSLPRPDGHGIAPDTRAGFHREICSDETIDDRFGSNLSNRLKVDYICGVIGYPIKAFDLEVAFPLEDWSVADDMSLLFAGLYLTDLRQQFYARQLRYDKEAADGRLFAPIGASRFWLFTFQKKIKARTEGFALLDGRTLH